MGEEQVSNREFAWSLDELLKPWVRKEKIKDYRRKFGLFNDDFIRESPRYVLEAFATLFTAEPEHSRVAPIGEGERRYWLAYAATAYKAMLERTILDFKISMLVGSEAITEAKGELANLAQKELGQIETFLQHLAEPTEQKRSVSVEAEG